MIAIDNIIYHGGSVKIHLSTGETVILAGDIVNQFALEKGKIINTEEYRQIKDESELYQCNKKAMNYLAIRNRSSREMQYYLMKKGFSGRHINEVLLRLKEFGYIDDAKFARMYVQERKRNKTMGMRLIRSELQKKGIDRKIIDRILRQVNNENKDREELCELAEKKMRRLEGKKNKTSKLSFFLRQRGFSSEEIISVLEWLRKQGFEI